MTTQEQITTTTELANEIFESTGFNYEIEETENADGTTTLTFDSPEDAIKFKWMTETPIDQWEA